MSQSVQSGLQQGVQYAGSGDFTPEQLAEARRIIANGQNPHPGVNPGFDDPYPVGAELMRQGMKGAIDVGIAAGTLAAPEVAAGARGVATAGRFVAMTDFGMNLAGGFGAGRQGVPFTPTTGSRASFWGGRVGFYAGVLDRTVGIGRALKVASGVFD